MEIDRRSFVAQAGGAIFTLKSNLFGPLMGADRAQARSLPLAQLSTGWQPGQGRILVRGAPLYAQFRRGFNLRLDISPAAIVICRHPAAVAATIRWARDHKLPIHLRSGGHAYEPLSTGPGILIDMSAMNGLRVDVTGEQIHVGAGARLGAITEFLAPHERALPSGVCSTVGLVGLALGGGYGLLSRRWGLTCDQLLSVELITAAGEHICASPLSHKDLFWACCGGGGGQFGAVTGLSMRVHPLGEVLHFKLTWPPEQMAAVLEAWQAWAPHADDGITTHLNITASAGSGMESLECTGLYAPPRLGEACDPAWLRRMLQALSDVGKPRVEITPKSYIAAARSMAGENPHPVYFKCKSDFADKALDGHGIRALARGLSSLSAGRITAILFAGGGALARVPLTATAYPHRKALFGIQYYCAWSAHHSTPAMLKSVDELYMPLRPFFSGRAYVNYADLDLADWAQAYFGPNLHRLQTVKARYDPEGIFSARPQAITLEELHP